MRKLDVSEITKAVRRLSMEANTELGEDIVGAFKACRETERSPTGVDVLGQLLENAGISLSEKMPLCQDTGVAVVFLDIGQEVELAGGDVVEAVNEGVRQGYKDGYLRKSIVKDPLRRVNTGDNTPAIIHTRIVPGTGVTVTVAPKGGGSENMSGVAMLKPSQGVEGVKKFIMEKVSDAGSNPCPPIIIGVGIGGTMEIAALIAKRALLRQIGQRNPDEYYAALETEMLDKINRLGVGPMGLGGDTTCLEVFIETHPCHIASLPVAVNVQCHSARHKEAHL